MSLSFKVVDEIFKSYNLVSHTIKNGYCTEYCFADKVINTKQKNVATRVRPLINGGVSGYIYVDHLREYDNYPPKSKMGHILIRDMDIKSLKETIEKVIKDYR